MCDIEARLQELEAEFQMLEPRERLELLLDYASRLPELPAELREAADRELHRVPECQTPVFLWLEFDSEGAILHAEVAPEAPTVQGFVSLLADLIRGCSPEQVARLPQDLLNRIGLVDALGMVRARGLAAIVHRVRAMARESNEPSAAR